MTTGEVREPGDFIKQCKIFREWLIRYKVYVEEGLSGFIVNIKPIAPDTMSSVRENMVNNGNMAKLKSEMAAINQPIIIIPDPTTIHSDVEFRFTIKPTKK